ncbi:protein phosphatase [Thermodesulfomicrobium sp. WS]|uniref:protein-tyrosine phosphatase family protein n=1 Tax=Thermodesulfomicrobium sp. WS TaxID=3004129 RepID=UPI00248F8549|nr:dual specificity protein phosphatase family protein [Thermodesulfomicrobium sp. WS]BDV02090.1 protein phosphatase [Thermodesulfomicrobium sp. WS]
MSQVHGPISWVTDRLAVGPAPMTPAYFHFLHEAGISALLNLCAEFPELPELQRQAGFEVYYLPIPDEEAPDLDALEAALAWLDESLYLGKKVLIHCRFGIGRTGTVLNAYFLRRGLGHRRAWWVLRPLRSKPTNFAQWRAVRRYGRQNPSLKAESPSLTFPSSLDLSSVFADYERLLARADQAVAGLPQCGIHHDRCCQRPGDLGLAAAAALAQYVDTHLPSATRRAIMLRAVANVRREDRIRHTQAPNSCLTGVGVLCPLLASGRCRIPQGRPLACRLWGLDAQGASRLWEETLSPALKDLDRQTWAVVTDGAPIAALPRFSFAQVVSGRWVQMVFAAMVEKRLAKGAAIF